MHLVLVCLSHFTLTSDKIFIVKNPARGNHKTHTKCVKFMRLLAPYKALYRLK